MTDWVVWSTDCCRPQGKGRSHSVHVKYELLANKLVSGFCFTKIKMKLDPFCHIRCRRKNSTCWFLWVNAENTVIGIISIPSADPESFAMGGGVPKSFLVITIFYLYPVNKAGDHRSFVIFQGVHTRISKKTHSFVIFQAGEVGYLDPKCPSQDPRIKHTMCLIVFVFQNLIPSSIFEIQYTLEKV